jgi:intracellular multiplication protein IcmD
MRYQQGTKAAGVVLPVFFTTFASELAWAAGATTGLSAVATTVQAQLTTVATLLVYVAYIAGIAFALTGILKFKAHKDAPQQVKLSEPIVLLAVSACLLFLPSVLNIAGGTLFGTSATGGGADFKGTVTPQ